MADTIDLSRTKPVTQTIGAGADSLVLKISQDAYLGAALYTVSVDGRQIGGTLTAGASHADGQSDTITVKGDFDPGDHKVTVTFLNDLYAWSPSADRNLYVDGITLNGKAVAGGKAALLAAGPASFTFTEAAATPGPAVQTIGSGADSLVLKISQDAYKGSAQYTISVDGKQVGGTLTANASHATGQSDTITVKGDFGPGDHKVTVTFLNDLYGWSAAADRNLYVDGITLNGKDVAGGKATLLAAGPVDLGFTKPAATTGVVTQTIGSGADSLVLKISQDAYKGSAQYTISVDGKQVGGTLTAGASHADGQSDTITVKGDFAAGAHKVTVTFLNDAYDGTAATDRNLYLDGVTLNGKEVAGGKAALLSTGPASIAFGTPVQSPGNGSGGNGNPGDGTHDHGVPGSFKQVWHESFDGQGREDVLGMFSRSWGPGVDTSVSGQLTIWTDANDTDSGAMVPPWGNADAGYGYGLYNFTLKTEGVIGIYALTWPATDVWPGPEMDVLEITPDGEGYFALHWKGENGTQKGENKFVTFSWGEVDLTQTHTFSMLWEHGRLTGFLDGEQRWTTTEHVPLDHAHGGENTAPGIGTQTWWNDGAMGGKNSITLYDASYSVIA